MTHPRKPSNSTETMTEEQAKKIMEEFEMPVTDIGIGWGSVEEHCRDLIGGPYVHWRPNDGDWIIFDCHMHIEVLEAIIWWMKNKQAEGSAGPPRDAKMMQI